MPIGVYKNLIYYNFFLFLKEKRQKKYFKKIGGGHSGLIRRLGLGQPSNGQNF